MVAAGKAARSHEETESGEDILYFTNYMSRGPISPQKYKTLHFTMEFEHDKDTVYLAHAFPYRYTDMQAHIEGICEDPVRSRFVERSLLCKSLAGNRFSLKDQPNDNSLSSFRVELLTITDGPMDDKKTVVLSARVHPGESCASYMMEGFLDFLTGMLHIL